jgi:hypothetical protein
MTKTKLFFAAVVLFRGATQVLAGSGQNGPIGPGSRYGLEPGPTDGVVSAPTIGQPSMAKARVNKEKRKATPDRGRFVPLPRPMGIKGRGQSGSRRRICVHAKADGFHRIRLLRFRHTHKSFTSVLGTSNLVFVSARTLSKLASTGPVVARY